MALKKYRCGRSPISNTSDNEHAAAALWNSEVLSVKNSVCEPIPELAQHPEEGSKIAPSVTRQDTGDVLPNQPFGAESASKRTEFQHEVATRIIQSRSESRNTEGLAGGSSDQKLDWVIVAFLYRGEIAVQWRVGVMVSEYGTGEWLYL